MGNREMSWTILQNFIVVPLTIAYLCNQLLAPLPSLEIDELSQEQQEWYQSGQMIDISPHRMFYKRLAYKGHDKNFPTIAIVHGFPSSSFDYHKVDLEKLREFGDVLLYDQIGFGFSDKPTNDFTYSVFELADYSTMLFQKLGLTDIVL